MIERPLSQVTCVSQYVASRVQLILSVLVMGKLADIIRDFCHTFSDDTSLNARFRGVKLLDERLNGLFDQTPDLRPNPDEIFAGSYHPTQPYDWRPWSRYLWALAIPPFRIQLWRSFLGRSYTSTRFNEARQICLDAARATIAARLKPVPVMYQKNWHVSSNTVTAGMVLAIELNNGGGDATTQQGLQHEIDHVLSLLRATSNPNSMVRRGIIVLEKMLAEAEEKITHLTAIPRLDPACGVPLETQSPINHLTSLGRGDDVSFWQTAAVPGDIEPESDLFVMLLNTEQWMSFPTDEGDSAGYQNMH